jgi:divalent metal cation (Fe/Co/Zn/Cd) transporter
MNEEVDRLVERCLTATRQSGATGQHDGDADAAFAALFAAVETQRPLPGFARRVVHRVKGERLVAGRRASRAGGARSAGAFAALAAVIFLADALLVALDPAVVLGVLALAVKTAVRAALSVPQLLTPAISLLGIVVSVGRALAAALATREASLLLSAALIAGALVLATLQRMLFSEEEPSVW